MNSTTVGESQTVSPYSDGENENRPCTSDLAGNVASSTLICVPALIILPVYAFKYVANSTGGFFTSLFWFLQDNEMLLMMMQDNTG